MSEDKPAGKELNENWDRTSELHEKYRSSGLALSVMIVTLSSAALHEIRPHQILIGLILFLPVALAIAHQTCIYMGQQNEARASWKLLVDDQLAKHLDTAGADPADRFKAFQDHWKKTSPSGLQHLIDSTNWFTWADRLCLAAAISFIVSGALAATQLPK